jgi:hypothetical protein
MRIVIDIPGERLSTLSYYLNVDNKRMSSEEWLTKRPIPTYEQIKRWITSLVDEEYDYLTKYDWNGTPDER